MRRLRFTAALLITLVTQPLLARERDNGRALPCWTLCRIWLGEAASDDGPVGSVPRNFPTGRAVERSGVSRRHVRRMLPRIHGERAARPFVYRTAAAHAEMPPGRIPQSATVTRTSLPLAAQRPFPLVDRAKPVPAATVRPAALSAPQSAAPVPQSAAPVPPSADVPVAPLE